MVTLRDGPAIAVAADEVLTFTEARLRADSKVAALRSAGVRAGECVIIAASSPAACYTAFAACWAGGFVAVVIDPESSARELENQLRKIHPAAVVVDGPMAAVLDRVDAACVPRIRLDTRDCAAASELARPDAVPIDDRDPAYLMATSGTTSEPKFVVISRRALYSHVQTLSRVFGYGSGAKLLHFLPTHHTDGLVHGIAASMFTGMSVVCPGKFSQTFDLYHAIREYRPSHLLTVPTILALIFKIYAESADLFDVPEFRHLISTAGFLDESLWERFERTFDLRVSNFYGMTETVSGSLYCGPNDSTYRRGSLGKPIDVDVRIVDENRSCVSDGAVGELQIRGLNVMSGYLGNDEATSAVLDAGWLSTGDLFVKDADGYYSIVGRRKNIVKRGGVTIYPEDVRKVVVEIAGVCEVEVLGIEDAVFGEILAVAAVVDEGVTDEAIRAVLHAELAPERRPDRIELFESLPRGASGKVLRPELIELFKARTPAGIDHERSLHDRVFALAGNAFAADVALLDERASPGTLANWDSYAGMEFVLALESEFDVHLGTREILSIRDLGSALAVVRQAIQRSARKAQ